MDNKQAGGIAWLLAWAVHCFTASGAVAGFMAILAIARGDWIDAFNWMGVTLAIDSVDGMLARAVRVKQVLPHFNGELLDNMVDYFTYVIVPAYFFYEADLLTGPFVLPIALAIILASGYQFCQADAKTSDHFFKGFPSYWNIVVFYLFFLELSPVVNTSVLLVLLVAVFVPIKYLYPSRTKKWRPLSLSLAGGWGLLLFVVLLRYPEGHLAAFYASFYFVIYYLLASVYLTVTVAKR